MAKKNSNWKIFRQSPFRLIFIGVTIGWTILMIYGWLTITNDGGSGDVDSWLRMMCSDNSDCNSECYTLDQIQNVYNKAPPDIIEPRKDWDTSKMSCSSWKQIGIVASREPYYGVCQCLYL